MAQNTYYSNPANDKLGKINIGLPVFNLIAEESIKEITGVYLGGKNAITSELDGNDISMVIHVKIAYGLLVSKLSKEVQEKVARAIMDMTNVKTKSIEVNVVGIEF